MTVDRRTKPAYISAMDVTGVPTTASASRRSAFAGMVSVAIHGGLLLAAVLLLHHRIASPSPTIELTSVQVVSAPEPPPPPPPPPGTGSQVRGATNTSPGTLGRRGRDAPPRSPSRAPVAPDPFAEVVVSYDTPTGPDPGNEAGTVGSGIGAGFHGDGTGSGDGGGLFGMGVPAPPPPRPSLARPPRPRHDYGQWNFRADRRFAGAKVDVELTIDPRGRVRNVRLLRGVEESIDERAIGLAQRFEFYPALDDAGVPIAGLHRWEFVLLGEATIEDHLSRPWR